MNDKCVFIVYRNYYNGIDYTKELCIVCSTHKIAEDFINSRSTKDYYIEKVILFDDVGFLL
jgi:hypothetical protein